VKLLREPLVHFMFIGAVIYALYGLFAEPAVEETDKTIVVTAGELEWMQTSWQKRWNRPPTAQEFDGLIQQFIKETVLYREALTMGLNKHDMVIRRRLAQKLEFLAKDLVALTPPTEDELLAYFDEHQASYQAPTLYTFTQVYFDPDKRGDATLDDANALLAELTAIGPPDAATADKGDRFLLRNEFIQQSELEVRKSLGSGFTASVMQLEPGQWHGPVLSGYGTHLVYVSALESAPDSSFEAVKDRVLQDWQASQQEAIEAEFYEQLKSRYEIVIEELPALPYTGRGSAAEVTGGAADKSGPTS